MRPVFGEFLAAAGSHIEAATGYTNGLAGDEAQAAVGYLSRVVTTMARLADGFRPSGGGRPARIPHANMRVEEDARFALRQAAGCMRQVTTTLTDHDRESTSPVAAHLHAASDHLCAGFDLLQTHFAPGPHGSRMRDSPWALIIVSPEINAAMLAQLVQLARLLAPWGIELSAAADTAPPGAARVSTACRWLRAAETVTGATISRQSARAANPPAAARNPRQHRASAASTQQQ